MTDSPHPRVAALLGRYAHELGGIETSSDLDARIHQMVAAHRHEMQAADRPPSHGPRRLPSLRRFPSLRSWAAAACLALVAVASGIVIGVRLGRDGTPTAGLPDITREPAWLPPEFSMWPADSVALKIPAEYSADGTLVAVDPQSRRGGTRYWVDIVVSNDGTVRIEKIVPAGGSDGITLQTP
jgi:hypothetical protein